MKNIAGKITGPVLALGVLSGCANSNDYISNLASETVKGLGEPIIRVAKEFDKGNLVAPLYATRGACNGLVRMGNAITDNKHNIKFGEDASICDSYLYEGATAGVVLAPVAPWSFLEGGLIGGAAGLIMDYKTQD
tara:strand:+ start:262 stop:666 length:405 start_codon:yes stop_codon:yes gene_type:complete